MPDLPGCYTQGKTLEQVRQRIRKAIRLVLESEKDAIKIGIEKFGNSPFFVRKIERIEQTQNFTSNLIMVN